MRNCCFFSHASLSVSANHPQLALIRSFETLWWMYFHSKIWIAGIRKLRHFNYKFSNQSNVKLVVPAVKLSWLMILMFKSNTSDWRFCTHLTNWDGWKKVNFCTVHQLSEIQSLQFCGLTGMPNFWILPEFHSSWIWYPNDLMKDFCQLFIRKVTHIPPKL